MLKGGRTMLIDLLHWAFLAVALLISLRIFRDLADLSQWVVQTPRDKIMWTFYNRHKLAAAAVAVWVAAALAWWLGDGGNTWAFASISLITLLLFYSGYINPGIMMRSQQHDGRYVPISEARRYVASGDSVIVVEAHGEARAHPDDHILRPHVAGTSDGLAGENVVMTYCGLTHMGIAYKPEIEGKALDLKVMTQLENNLVMWDKNTGEPVQQFWGALERDGPKGPRMPEWPSFRMPFEKFAEAFPNGKVFVNPFHSASENPFLAIYDRLMHMIFRHGICDQALSEKPTFPTIKHFDERLRNKERIYGVNVGNDYVAYTEDFIHQNGDLLNVRVGDRDIVIAYHARYDSFGMYYNDSGAPVTRIDFGGDSDHGKLLRVETMKAQAYWVVWANFFTDTDINRGPELKAAA